MKNIIAIIIFFSFFDCYSLEQITQIGGESSKFDIIESKNEVVIVQNDVVCFYDILSGDQTKVHTPKKGRITHFRMNKNKSRYFLSFENKDIYVYDYDGEFLRKLEIKGDIFKFQISENESFISIVADKVYYFNYETGALINSFDMVMNYNYAGLLSHGGNYFFYWQSNIKLIYDVVSSDSFKIEEELTNTLYDLSKDGSKIAYMGYIKNGNEWEYEPRIYNIENDENIKMDIEKYSESFENLNTAKFGYYSDILAVSIDNDLIVLNSNTGEMIEEYQEIGEIIEIIFSNSDNSMFVYCSDNIIKKIDRISNKISLVIDRNLYLPIISDMKILQGNKDILAVGDYHINKWNLHTAKLEESNKPIYFGTKDFSFSKDGDYLIAKDDVFNKIKVWKFIDNEIVFVDSLVFNSNTGSILDNNSTNELMILKDKRIDVYDLENMEKKDSYEIKNNNSLKNLIVISERKLLINNGSYLTIYDLELEQNIAYYETNTVVDFIAFDRFNNKVYGYSDIHLEERYVIYVLENDLTFLREIDITSIDNMMVADGGTKLIAFRKDEIIAYDTDSFDILYTIPRVRKDSQILRSYVSPDGNYLLILREDRNVCVYLTSTGKLEDMIWIKVADFDYDHKNQRIIYFDNEKDSPVISYLKESAIDEVELDIENPILQIEVFNSNEIAIVKSSAKKLDVIDTKTQSIISSIIPTYEVLDFDVNKSGNLIFIATNSESVQVFAEAIDLSTKKSNILKDPELSQYDHSSKEIIVLPGDTLIAFTFTTKLHFGGLGIFSLIDNEMRELESGLQIEIKNLKHTQSGSHVTLSLYDRIRFFDPFDLKKSKELVCPAEILDYHLTKNNIFVLMDGDKNKYVYIYSVEDFMLKAVLKHDLSAKYIDVDFGEKLLAVQSQFTTKVFDVNELKLYSEINSHIPVPLIDSKLITEPYRVIRKTEDKRIRFEDIDPRKSIDLSSPFKAYMYINEDNSERYYNVFYGNGICFYNEDLIRQKFIYLKDYLNYGLPISHPNGEVLFLYKDTLIHYLDKDIVDLGFAEEELLHFSADGSKLFTFGEYSSKVFNYPSGTVSREITTAVRNFGLCISSDITQDGKLIAFGNQKGKIEVRNTETDELILRKTINKYGIERAVGGLKFHPGGEFIVAKVDNREARIIELKSGNEVDTIPVLDDMFYFSNDGRLLLTSSDNRCIKVWNFDSILSAQDPDISYTNERDNNRIYPNPTFDQIILSLHEQFTSKPEIVIIDNLGYIHEPKYQINNKEITINTSTLYPGVYYLCIRSGGQVETKKFVVVR